MILGKETIISRSLKGATIFSLSERPFKEMDELNQNIQTWLTDQYGRPDYGLHKWSYALIRMEPEPNSWYFNGSIPTIGQQARGVKPAVYWIGPKAMAIMFKLTWV